MRRLAFSLLALTLTFAVDAAAQDNVPPWANKFFTGKETPPPVILQDFGTLPKGTVRTYRFKMTNIYAVPMQVRPMNPSCGCISVLEYTGKMNPRETGHIDVELQTGRVDGYKSVQLKVRFEGRDAKSGEVFYSYADLEMRVVSRQDIVINPGEVEFGVIAQGQKATQVVNVFYTGRQRNWEIVEKGYNKDLFDVTVDRVNAKGGIAYQVTATIKNTAPAGAISEQIVLKTNDADQKGQVLQLSVSGQVQPPLSVVPSDLIKMGGVEVGKKLEKSVVIRSDKAFKIAAVEGQGDGVTIPMLPVDARKSQPIAVTFAPEKPGAVKKSLKVKMDTGETITLTVEAVGTEPR